jgi:hypothetical protein
VNRGRRHDDNRTEWLTKTYNLWEYRCRKPHNRVFQWENDGKLFPLRVIFIGAQKCLPLYARANIEIQN